MHLPPLRFEPIYRQYVWGGRRLATHLDKQIPDGDVAESWEVVDHGHDQSRVSEGPFAGATLGQLCESEPTTLFGSHPPPGSFPLLFKFLDAHRNLSVQVHPNDQQAARLDPPDLGKTEAWVILHAEPGAQVFAGLKRGFDRAAFEREVHRGTAELCLHRFAPRVGDCIFIPAGCVHALGAGLLVAEIQQASDTTYRLYDWNRVGTDGRPRALHVQEGLEVIDDTLGPMGPRTSAATERPFVERLVSCEKFVLDRWRFEEPAEMGGDDRFHLVAVLAGTLNVAGLEQPLTRGRTFLLPTSGGVTCLEPKDPTLLLDIYLPD
jgi:mannose-6-phosphate isomerase